MSVFSLEDIQKINIVMIFPENLNDYVKLIAEKVPLATITVESITKRQDVFKQIFDLVPRYIMSGNNISYEFYQNKFQIRLGETFPPSLLEEEQKMKFEKSLFDKINLDANYFVGLIYSLKNLKYSDLKINIQIEIEKETSKLKYSNIANKECKGIFDKGFSLSGLSLIKRGDKVKIEYDIQEIEDSISVDYEKEFTIIGPIDLNKIIDLLLSEVNELTLKL
jgi:hypothetical protein